MNILVTGATGLVGRELVLKLVHLGHSVKVLAREPKTAAKKMGPKVKVFAWDGVRQVPPHAALEGLEALIHLAGENVAQRRWTTKRKQEIQDSRIASAVNLRRGLDAAGVKLKVFISASGAGYYGDRGDQSLTESEPPGEDFLARLCVQWEAAADLMPADRIVKARFGAVLCADGGFLGEIVPIFKMVGASRLGSGRQWTPWIHVDDLVRMLITALTDGRMQGAVNTVAPESVTNAEMTEEIRRVVRTRSAPSAPKFVLRLLYGEMADVLLFSQKARPQRLEEWKFKFEYPKLRHALEDLLIS